MQATLESIPASYCEPGFNRKSSICYYASLGGAMVAYDCWFVYISLKNFNKTPKS